MLSLSIKLVPQRNLRQVSRCSCLSRKHHYLPLAVASLEDRQSGDNLRYKHQSQFPSDVLKTFRGQSSRSIWAPFTAKERRSHPVSALRKRIQIGGQRRHVDSPCWQKPRPFLRGEERRSVRPVVRRVGRAIDRQDDLDSTSFHQLAVQRDVLTAEASIGKLQDRLGRSGICARIKALERLSPNSAQNAHTDRSEAITNIGIVRHIPATLAPVLREHVNNSLNVNTLWVLILRSERRVKKA
jgi:hypothetical protein